MTNDATVSAEPSAPPPSAARAGIIAVVGRANVGKSSLVNAILGEKISIVSPVAQTTRHRIRGILNDARGQIVFLDTPGVLKAVSDLGEWMNKAARQSAEGTDALLLVVDTSGPPRAEDEGWIKRIVGGGGSAPVIVALNKTDLGGRYERAFVDMWAAVEAEKERKRPATWIRVSAESGGGIADLVNAVFGALPEHPALFPENILTDFPRKLFVGDVIREKLFLRLDKELPHRIAVYVNGIDELPDGAWEVKAEIWVERGSQKGIVIGNKGRMLRAIRRASDAELTAIYEHPVRVIL